MIRTISLVIFALMFSSIAAKADVARPSLRAEATVTGSTVKIGDLINNAGIVADVPIFRAPALGQTGMVSATQVLDAVRSHGLVGIDPRTVSEIRVTRASRVITPGEIEALLASSLARTYGLGAARDVGIEFDRTPRRVQVELDVTAPAQIEQLRYDARSGRFDALLEITGASGARLRLSGTAVATAEAVTLSRSLARGDMVKLSDLALKRIARSQITSDTITDPEQAIGRVTRDSIGAGYALRSSELTKQKLVLRNESVTLVYRAPGIMLAVRGKAVDGGAEGDVIDVVNVQSNRTVRGTISGPGQVSVTSMAARVVTSADAMANETPSRSNAK
jgi:flagella basal body P-ring formation protein FlgA